MHPRLRAIQHDFASASERLQRLVETVPAPDWVARPQPARWSVAECVAHLNLTADAFLPPLRSAIDEARERTGIRPRYRRDPLGWMLWKTMGPPVRMKIRTAASFVPHADLPPEKLVATFMELQAEQMALVEAAAGLPLQAVRVPSPFHPRVRYNAYSALSILPRHQHRHLWQAEQAVSVRS